MTEPKLVKLKSAPAPQMSVTAALDSARACVRGEKAAVADPGKAGSMGSTTGWIVTTMDPKRGELSRSQPMDHRAMVQHKSAMQAAFAATRLGLPLRQLDAAFKRAMGMREETRIRLEALIAYYNLQVEVPPRTKLRFGGRR